MTIMLIITFILISFNEGHCYVRNTINMTSGNYFDSIRDYAKYTCFIAVFALTLYLDNYDFIIYLYNTNNFINMIINTLLMLFPIAKIITFMFGMLKN